MKYVTTYFSSIPEDITSIISCFINDVRYINILYYDRILKKNSIVVFSRYMLSSTIPSNFKMREFK
jgi:hypothetical protein